MIYSNFFSPPIISMLFCLHESTVEGEEKDPNSPNIRFLIDKILRITDSSSPCLTGEQFQGELLSITGDYAFLQRYRKSVSNVKCFNDFYREVSKMLKTLRSLRSNKLEQGNLIDFLVRRMYIYFEKLDFKEIVRIYEQFDRYRNNKEVVQQQHEFMLTKSIEQIKFNLQNYGGSADGAELSRRVQQLGQYDHTNKSSYLKALVRAGEGRPIDAIDSMHRYFDKSLGNLFQQKSQVSLMSNKINHCILSSAFVQLKMQCLQQCLQSISEGLRISQNNSDEQSINNCIIYLYRISEQLGRYQQQILLNEHAITHSLNLTNSVLMVYSCLNYSLFQKKYNCSDPNILLLKHRSISWTDALHFSRRKIYASFESNCKNIYHSYRNLLIPSFMCKLAVLAHLPELTHLLINPYYQRESLTQLEVYNQFIGKTPIEQQLQRTLRYCRNRQSKMLEKQIRLLRENELTALSPQFIIKIKAVLCRVKIEWGNLGAGHREAERLAEQCQKYGFVKEELLQAWTMATQVMIHEGLYYDAMVKVEQTIKHCQQQKLKEYQIVTTLLGVQARLLLNWGLEESLASLEHIQQESNLMALRKEFRIIFYQTKILAYRKVHQSLFKNLTFFDQCQQLKLNQFRLLSDILKLQLDNANLTRIRHTLLAMYDILLVNPTIIEKKLNQRVRNALTYCEKALNNYSTIDTDAYPEEELLKRVVTKVKTLYLD